MGALLTAAYTDVQVSLGENGPLMARCECSSGNLKCSHAAALAMFGIFNVSCTDAECQWRKPAVTNKLKSVKDLYTKPYYPLSADQSAEDGEWLLFQLEGHPSAMQWLLSPEPGVASSAPPVPSVQHISDIYARQGVDVILQQKKQKQVNTAHWMFFFVFHTILCKIKRLCENPRISAISEISKPPCLVPTIILSK